MFNWAFHAQSVAESWTVCLIHAGSGKMSAKDKPPNNLETIFSVPQDLNHSSTYTEPENSQSYDIWHLANNKIRNYILQ